MAMTISGSSGVTYPDGTSQVSGQQACKAWVNFNGTGTVAIRASYNVSSITDGGTGLYTVNFTTAMPDVDYAMVGTTANVGVSFGCYVLDNSTIVSRTTSSISIYTTSFNQILDASFVNIAIFR